MVNTVDVIVDTKDAESVINRINDWLNEPHLSDMTRDLFSDVMKEEAEHQFNVGGDPSWQPLKTATIVRRIAMGFGAGPINVRTGAMEKHVTQSTAHGGPTTDGAEFSWPDSAHGELYMKLLRAQGWDKRVPARPVINADDSEVDEFITRAFNDLEAFVR